MAEGRRWRALSFGALAVAGAALAARGLWHQAPTSRAPVRFSVDFGATSGAYARLSGVQGSPAPIVADDVDHRERFRAVRVVLSRFPQDCEPNSFTLSGIFPDAEADPDDPRSYRFERIDRLVEAARSAGCEVLWQSSYDVGGTDSWKGFNLGGRAPRDLELWCRVVTRCLEHFNVGWAGGFDRAVGHVEFVNEPTGLGGFVGPDVTRALPAFLAFLRAVSAYAARHPGAPVRAVGPGIPFCWDVWPEWRPRFAALLDAVAAAGLPLPVFSFHTYGTDTSPRDNEQVARGLRALLDERGFGATELWNTEWQGPDYLRERLVDGGLHVRGRPDLRLGPLFASGLATYALSCKVRWQGLLTGSCYYLAGLRAVPKDGDREGRLRAFAPFGLVFPPDGRVTPLALQEALTLRLAERTPERCPVARPDADDGLAAALATRSADGARRGLLLCNLDLAPREFVVDLAAPGSTPRPPAFALDLVPGAVELAPRPASAVVVSSGAGLVTTVPALSSRLLEWGPGAPPAR